MANPADRFKVRATRGAGKDDPVLDPDRPVSLPDRALDRWAHFTLQVQTPIVLVDDMPGGAFGHYDRQTHRYQRHYIQANTYEVFLDAKVGLQYGHLPMSSAATARRSAVEPEVGLVGDLRDAPLAPPDMHPPSSGTDLIPDGLTAYSWRVTSSSGWHRSKLVQPPVSPLHIAVFMMPADAARDFSVELRVYFDSGRFGQRLLHVTLEDEFIVSLGDSFAAGEGNPDRPGNPDSNLQMDRYCQATTLAKALGSSPAMSNEPVWFEPKAHRSMNSGPARAAKVLDHRSGGTLDSQWQPVERLDLHLVTFASFARSGARIGSGLLDPQVDPVEDDMTGTSQVEECKRSVYGRRISKLVISGGGNDAGFAGTLESLVKEDSVLSAGLKGLAKSVYRSDIGDDELARTRLAPRLKLLLGVGLGAGEKGVIESRLDSLNAKINQELRQHVGIDAVFLTGYPTGLFDTAGNGHEPGFAACGLFSGPDMDITSADNSLIKEQGHLLNDLLQRKAIEFGWTFVDVEAAFAGHGYCAHDSYWVSAEESCMTQGDFMGTLHPNGKGHEAYAQALIQSFGSQ